MKKYIKPQMKIQKFSLERLMYTGSIVDGDVNYQLGKEDIDEDDEFDW